MSLTIPELRHWIHRTVYVDLLEEYLQEAGLNFREIGFSPCLFIPPLLTDTVNLFEMVRLRQYISSHF